MCAVCNHCHRSGDADSISNPLNALIMKNNLGSADRIIRVILAVVMAALYFTGTVTGTFGTVLVVLAGVFVLTSLIGFCPLYAIFGIKTCKTA